MRNAKPLSLIGMSWRNLYRQPVRSCLTALGVAVGVMAIVSFGSITTGVRDSINAAIRFEEGDMLVFQRGVGGDIFSTLDEEKIGAALLANPDVIKATPYLIQILPAGRLPFACVIGLHDETVREHAHMVVRGRPVENRNEVLLGAVAARLLNVDVGDVLRISLGHYKVVGVFDTGIVVFDAALVLNMEQLQQITGREAKVTSFQVTVREGANPSAIANRLENSIPGIAAVANAEQYQRVDQGYEILKAMNWEVSFLAILIGSIIVGNTMWMAVNERTREIGVLRAIGWSRSRIVKMIIVESAGVSLVAWVLGGVLGVVLAQLSTCLPVAAQFVNPVFGWEAFAMALGVAVVLGVLGGALPAWRAARVSPVEALRHE